MLTVAVAMQKGGCGKSTLSRHGSVLLPRTALLDLDPQGTSLAWMAARKATGDTVPTMIETSFTRAAEALDRVRTSGAVDTLVIDTPPEHDDQRVIRLAVNAADFVVLPCKTSDDDLRVLEETLKLVSAAGKPFGVVFSMVIRKNSKLLVRARERVEALLESYPLGSICPETIGNRSDIVESADYSMSVTEFAPKGETAREMQAVWAWIIDAAKSSKKEV